MKPLVVSMFPSDRAAHVARIFSVLRLLALAGIVFLSVPSCDMLSSGQSVSEEDIPDAVVEEEELPAVEAPQVDQALLIFLSGDVSVRMAQEGQWRPANIGDSLPPGAAVQVGDGFAELQFGDVGTVRVREETTVAIDSLYLQDGEREVKLDLQRGRLLNKVDQLAGRGDYRVRTHTAVCGVRGTQFGVNVRDGQDTQVAVREGRVSVLPSSADPDRIREKAGTSAAANAVADSVIQAIDDSAPVVEANQEMVMDQAAVDQTEETIRRVEETIEQVAKDSPDSHLPPEATRTEAATPTGEAAPSQEAPDDEVETAQADQARQSDQADGTAEDVAGRSDRTDETAQPDERATEPAAARRPPRRRPMVVDLDTIIAPEIAAEIKAAAEETGRNVQATVAPAVELSQEAQRDLEEIETIRYIQLPPTAAPAAAPETDADSGDQPDGVAGTQSTQAEDADGGAPAAADQPGAEEAPVEPAAAPQPTMPALVPLVVNVEPRDATIKLDGRVVGRGSFSGLYLQGETVDLKMELATYNPKEMRVTMEQASGRSIRVELAKIPQPVYSRVDIRVDPSDAAIVVNGEGVGNRRYRERYEVGTRLQIEARLDGYVAYRDEIEVMEDQEALEIVLERMRANLRVTAEPGDAQIEFGEETVGEGSAVRTFEVGQEIPVRVTRDGYYPAEQTVLLTEDMQPVAFDLERIYHPVTIETEPTGATIYLNDERVGLGSADLSLPDGDSVTIRAEASGYDTVSTTATVRENMETVSLTLPRTMGQVSVEATPEDATIRMDDGVFGVGSAQGEYPVQTTVQVSVDRTGYEPVEETVYVTEDPTVLQFDLERMYRAVEATVFPRNATVYLDDEPVATGSFEGTFAVGQSFDLRFALENYHETSRTVRVVENQRPIRVTLERIMEPIWLQVEPAGAEVRINGRRVGTGDVREELPVGTEARVEVTRDGYHPQEQTVAITENMEPMAFSLERIMGSVIITPEPADATVYVNGRSVGTGPFRQEYPAGETLRLRIERDNYETETDRITVAESGITRNYTLERSMAPLEISAVPRGAAISVDGRRVGTGTYRGQRPVGDRVRVSVEMDNYETESRTVTISASGQDLQFALDRAVADLRVQVTPADATITVNDQEVGTGSYRSRLDVGDRVRVSVSRENYESQSRTVTIGGSGNTLNFNLDRQEGTVAIDVEPRDAEVSVDGRVVGTGSQTHESYAGERLRVTAERPGFSEASETVQVRPGRQRITLTLNPQPMVGRIRLGEAPLVRSVVSDGSRLYVADTNGTFWAVDATGQELWEVSTNNVGNENSIPVASGDRVVFSGAAELVVVNTETGRTIHRRNLPSTESHLFGRRAIPFPGGFLYPTDQGLMVLSRDGDETGRVLSVPSGTKASPAVVDGQAYVADQQGTIHVFDISSGRAITQIRTGMSQPVAHAPAVGNNHLVFVGRRGTVSAINSDTNTVAWEQELPGGAGSFTDPVMGDGVVYVRARNELSAYDLRSGEALFGPISNMATDPVIVTTARPDDGTGEMELLIAGFEDRSVRLLDPDTGDTVARLSAPAVPMAAAVPTGTGREIVLGLDSGELLFVHPDGME